MHQNEQGAASLRISPAEAEQIDIACAKERTRLEAAFDQEFQRARQKLFEETASDLNVQAVRAIRSMRDEMEHKHRSEVADLQEKQRAALVKAEQTWVRELQANSQKAVTELFARFDEKQGKLRALRKREIDQQIAEARSLAIRECELRADVARSQLREAVAAQHERPVEVIVKKLPRRKTTTTVSRDGVGAISGSTQTEQDS